MAKIEQIIVVPTLDTAIYAAGDVLFNACEIPNIARIPGGRVNLRSILVVDGDDQAQAFDLIFMSTATILGTINAAVSISDANLITGFQGGVSFVAANAIDFINSTIYQAPGPLVTHPPLNMLMDCADNISSLWVSGIVRAGTPTYSAAGMTIKLGVERF